MNRRLLVSVFVSILTMSVLSAQDDAVGASAGVDTVYEPHDRIVIMGNEDFTAENGVRSGEGTYQDPYVIEGWEIDLSEGPASNQYSDGIVVQNTDARFVIRNVWIHSGLEADTEDGSLGSRSAIMMYHVRLATVQDCVLSNCSMGIHIMDCMWISVIGCLVADNHGSGISTSMCEYIQVRDCTIARNYWGGVEFSSAAYCSIVDSTVTGSEHWLGVNLYQAESSSVRNCNVSYNAVIGINVGFSNNCNVSGNLVKGNGIGMCVYGTESMTIESNVYLDNDEDIRDDNESEFTLVPAFVMVVIVVAIIAATLFLDRRRRLKDRPK